MSGETQMRRLRGFGDTNFVLLGEGESVVPYGASPLPEVEYSFDVQGQDERRSGVWPQTVGGSGNNELSFEDTAGAEQVYLHAQRNLDAVVENDHTVRVRRDETITVSGNQTQTVTGWQRETVVGDQVSGGREWPERDRVRRTG